MQDFFNPEVDYVLENNCVLLRPLVAEDYDNLLLFALNEPQLWTYSLTEVAGEIPMKNYLSAALAGRKAGKEYPFIVFDKRTQEYAGCTRFYDIQWQNQVLQLGYTWYGRKFHGTGLNQHCKFLLLSFAFEKAGMLRVEFRADQANARSIAAMKKIGCQVEGILRSNLPKPDGTRRDSIVLSILKSEWDQRVKQLLKAQLK
jgi:N-acetyltransferase